MKKNFRTDEFAEFIHSPADINSCIYAEVSTGTDQVDLVCKRIDRLIKDHKIDGQQSKIFALTSSDENRDKIRRMLTTMDILNIKIESVTNLGLVDTKALFEPIKYLVCVNMANFKAENIYNLLRVSKGKHLTVTDDIDRENSKLNKARQALKLYFGGSLTSFRLRSKTKSKAKVDVKVETKVKSETKGGKGPRVTPSVELLRSIVNSNSLCSKVNAGLLNIKNDTHLLQLVLRFLSNPQDTTVLLMMISFLCFPNGVKFKKKDMTTLCNIIDKECLMSGPISAFDFFIKFDSSLKNIRNLTNLLFRAIELVEIHSRDHVISAIEVLLKGMRRYDILNKFKEMTVKVDEKGFRHSNSTTNWLKLFNDAINELGDNPISSKMLKDIDLNDLNQSLSQMKIGADSPSTWQRPLSTNNTTQILFRPTFTQRNVSLTVNRSLKLARRR